MLGTEGEIVRGANDATWTSSRPRWASSVDWLGEPGDPMTTESAQAHLIRTWLRAFGPASADDITWWFGSRCGWRSRHPR